MLTFTETSLWGKSWTQITKVSDTNYLDMSRCLRQSLWEVHDKPVCVVLMEFGPSQCTESPRQSQGQVFDKVVDLSRTQVMKVGDVIYVTDFHDLCPRLCREIVPDFVAESVMEFGLIQVCVAHRRSIQLYTVCEDRVIALKDVSVAESPLTLVMFIFTANCIIECIQVCWPQTWNTHRIHVILCNLMEKL